MSGVPVLLPRPPAARAEGDDAPKPLGRMGYLFAILGAATASSQPASSKSVIFTGGGGFSFASSSWRPSKIIMATPCRRAQRTRPARRASLFQGTTASAARAWPHSDRGAAPVALSYSSVSLRASMQMAASAARNVVSIIASTDILAAPLREAATALSRVGCSVAVAVIDVDRATWGRDKSQAALGFDLPGCAWQLGAFPGGG